MAGRSAGSRFPECNDTGAYFELALFQEELLSGLSEQRSVGQVRQSRQLVDLGVQLPICRRAVQGDVALWEQGEIT